MGPASVRLVGESRSERIPVKVARSASSGVPNMTSYHLGSQFWSEVLHQPSKHYDASEDLMLLLPLRLREESTLNRLQVGESLHCQMIASMLHLRALESRNQAQMSEKECADLLVSAKLCFDSACGHTGKICLNRATRSTVKSNVSGPHRTYGFKIGPTTTEFENDNSVKVFVDLNLPIGAITLGKVMLADSEFGVPRECPEYLMNEPVLVTITRRELLDKWMKSYPYSNTSATVSESEMLACRQIDDCYVMVANSTLTLEQLHQQTLILSHETCRAVDSIDPIAYL